MPSKLKFPAAELSAADGLICLSLSRGGFCLQQLPPLSPPPARKRTRVTPAEGLSYTCNVCGATFKSPQALGGHKTRHRPRPTKPAAASAACSISMPGHVSSGGSQVFFTRQYQEKDSGEAWSGGSPPESSKEVSTVEEGGVPPASGRRGLDIDLNLPYIVDE